jgi:hypothetical protein
MVNRRVEREILVEVVKQNGHDPTKVAVRLNWGSPETPEIVASDLIFEAEKNLIRPKSFERTSLRFKAGRYVSQLVDFKVKKVRFAENQTLL